MDRARWKNLNEIFDSAVEHSPEERPAYLDKALGNDSPLRLEIEALLDADRKTAEFLEQPCLQISGTVQNDSSQSSGFQINAVVSDRFKILRLLGTGGMGHVYEAWDTELGVHLALKTIRPEISQNPAILSQFRSEVRLARQITHPNVCRIFEFQHQRGDPTAPDGQAGLLYLTMEFLSGEDLRQRLNERKALPAAEALRIAEQMAEGLRAAHFNGVVHRDIKPANVMLVPSSGDERAVITDFGLARVSLWRPGDPHSRGLSQMGIIGTPAYMAPEQMHGGEVTAATDMYAFGLVLYEMLTGTQAKLEALAKKDNWLRAHPTLATLPAAWRRALEKCLEIRPQDRFQNAGEMIDFLDQSLHSGFAAAGKRLTKRQRCLSVAAIFLACVSLSFLGYRLYERGAEAKIAPGSTVLFSTVRNQTGNRSFDNVTSLMQNQLTQAAQFNLLGQDRVHAYLQQMGKPPETPVEGAVAREVALRAGAARIVSGKVSKGNTNQYTLTINVEQPDSKPQFAPLHTWEKQWSWQASSSTDSNQIPAGLLSAVRDGSQWVRREVGESANDVARLDAPPEDVTTDKWDALAEYTEAQRLYTDGKPEQAIASLRDAVSIDPQFALAWGRLGDILATTNQYQASYQAYSKALEVDQERHLTRRERDRIKGSFASDTGDFEAAETAFADMSTYYPNDWLAWFYRAYPLFMLDRPQAAIMVLEKANTVSPGNRFVLEHLADYSLFWPHSADVQRWTGELTRYRHLDQAEYASMLAAFQAGDGDGVFSHAELLKESTDAFLRGASYRMMAREAVNRGKFEEAIRILDDSIRDDEGSGQIQRMAEKFLDRAYVHCMQGAYDFCLKDVSQSLKVDGSAQGLRLGSALLSTYALRTTGATQQAFLAQLQSLKNSLTWQANAGDSFRLAVMQVHAEKMLADNKPFEALRIFEEVSQLDSPVAPREYLVRALIALANQSPPPKRQQLLQRVVQAGSASLARPGILAVYPTEFPPGIGAELRSEIKDAKAALDVSKDVNNRE